MPDIVEVYRDDTNWKSKDFNNYSSLYSEYNGEELGYTFFVNCDNIHLINEQKNNSADDPTILKAQYKYSLVIMGMSMIKANDDKILKETEDLTVSEMISIFTTSISPVILPLLGSLGELAEMDTELTLF